jgi:EAL domain-containing protein (putative c-di-GMP-specific phosphodiesterase class I)
VEHELRDALTRGELTLHYQPLVRVDGLLVGFEALLRWQHPTRGILAPGEFLGFAEQSILSADVTAWVIDQAVRDASERLRPGISVSVNVPIEDLRRDDFVDRTLETLATYALPPEQLKIELLENQLADAVDGPIERLIAAGVQFVVDDFGTGYSALAYLKRLPVASVKIDRSFVVGITDDPVDASIVRAIVEACRATGRTCVAEGVERASQALLLAELGVTTLQGELLGRAAPLATYAEIIEAGRLNLAPTLAVASVLRVAPRLGES